MVASFDDGGVFAGVFQGLQQRLGGHVADRMPHKMRTKAYRRLIVGEEQIGGGADVIEIAVAQQDAVDAADAHCVEIGRDHRTSHVGDIG